MNLCELPVLEKTAVKWNHLNPNNKYTGGRRSWGWPLLAHSIFKEYLNLWTFFIILCTTCYDLWLILLGNAFKHLFFLVHWRVREFRDCQVILWLTGGVDTSMQKIVHQLRITSPLPSMPPCFCWCCRSWTSSLFLVPSFCSCWQVPLSGRGAQPHLGFIFRRWSFRWLLGCRQSLFLFSWAH